MAQHYDDPTEETLISPDRRTPLLDAVLHAATGWDAIDKTRPTFLPGKLRAALCAEVELPLLDYFRVYHVSQHYERCYTMHRNADDQMCACIAARLLVELEQTLRVATAPHSALVTSPEIQTAVSTFLAKRIGRVATHMQRCMQHGTCPGCILSMHIYNAETCAACPRPKNLPDGHRAGSWSNYSSNLDTPNDVGGGGGANGCVADPVLCAVCHAFACRENGGGGDGDASIQERVERCLTNFRDPVKHAGTCLACQHHIPILPAASELPAADTWAFDIDLPYFDPMDLS